MAAVLFPAGAKVTRMDISLEYPGLIRHDLQLTGGQNVLYRGEPRWRGNVTIAPAQGALASAIEVMFNQLADPENWVELPLNRPALLKIGVWQIRLYAPRGLGLHYISSLSTPQSDLDTLVGDNALCGRWFSKNNKVYQITKCGVGSRGGGIRRGAFVDTNFTPVEFIPEATNGREMFVGVVIPATTIRARSYDSVPINTRTPDWSGPWTWQWVDAT